MLISLAALTFSSCKDEGAHYPSFSKTFVLVHGAWQAPWVWDEAKNQLINTGQKVIVIELPAHGDYASLPINTSLDIYREAL